MFFFSPPKITNYRPDIDGLRAIAIIAVVIFHTFPESFPSGFIGVDIFFVISGFLISQIIFKKLQNGSFSFLDFYNRRARRIFPALIFLLIATFIAGWFLLAPPEMRLLMRQISWGSFFGENIYLIKSTGGYWDQSTEMMPLMHLWTLAVEEQYYLIYPLLCFFCWRFKKLLPVLIFSALLSFAFNYLFSSNSILNFYSLHTRFWELCSGGLLAYFHCNNKSQIRLSVNLQNVISILGICLIFWGFFQIDERDKFPGIVTLFPVLGAVCLLLSSNSFVNKSILSNKIFVIIGLWSYTWYLWHWPPLAFSRIIMGGNLPAIEIRILLLLIGFCGALVSYYLIENPIRKLRATFKLTCALSTIILATFISATSVRILHGLPQRLSPANQLTLKSAKNSFPHSTEYCQKIYAKNSVVPYSFCFAVSGETPEVAVIGDSHARHLMPGLIENSSKKFITLGMKATPAVFNIYEITAEPNKNKLYDQETMVTKALNHVLDTPSIKTVILASRWNLFLTAPDLYRWIPDNKIDFKDSQSREAIFKHFLFETLTALKNKNKQTIIVLNVPEFPFNVFSCFRPHFSKEKCGVSINEAIKNTQEVNQIIKEVASSFPGVEVIDPSKIFCSNGECSLVKDGYAVYRDDNHLTSYGSSLLAPSILSKMKSSSPSLK